MPVLTIRDVDPAVKAAIEERAKKEGISQSQVARRALADGLGVKVKKRDLTNLGIELFGEEGLRQLNEIDWTKPMFTDAELDEMMEEKDRRIAEGMNTPAPARTPKP